MHTNVQSFKGKGDIKPTAATIQAFRTGWEFKVFLVQSMAEYQTCLRTQPEVLCNLIDKHQLLS